MVELLTFMVHRRQELERKEAEEELAQAREEEGEEEEEEEQLQQAQQAQQAQVGEKLGEENPSHASLPPDEAKETQESGLLPSSKRIKSCF